MPKAILKYDWADDVSSYVSWSRGFKAGGLNAQVFNREGGFAFDPEGATSWELGTKARFLDGSAALDVALFRQTVTDLQTWRVASTW